MTELFRFSLRTPAQRRGLAYGLLSAWLLLIVGFFAYNSAFRGVIDTPGVRAALEGKLRDFGVYSVTDFIVLSFFIAVIHSLLEEYFWRFYVCAEMERIFSARWSGAKLQLLAILASSLAFTLHHIVVITHYAQVEQNRLLIIALASFVVFACGALWASLYMRYRNVYVIWISHIAADLVMLGMGYDVIYR